MDENAAEALMKLPTTGERFLYEEACEALGLELRGNDFYHEENRLATIENGGLTVHNEAVRKLKFDLPPLNDKRLFALNSVYFRLDKDRVAIHEAGHAVAAWMKAVDFCFVRIGVEHEIQLCAKWSREAADVLRRCPWPTKNRQYVLAAGAAAEKLVFGDYGKQGVESDRKELNADEELLRDAKGVNAPKDLDVFDEWATKVAEKLCPEEVRAVAKRLIEREFLSRKEVKQIIETTRSANDD